MKVRSLLCVATVLMGGAMLRADVTGSVKIEGKAPEVKPIDMSGKPECHAMHKDPMNDETYVVGANGELANVAVYLKLDEGQTVAGDAPKEPAVLDQHGCQYSPHVLPVMVGQKLVIKNSDEFMHNVHSLSEVNPAFNFAQPTKDEGKDAPEQPAVPENYKVKCDVHSWMGARIIVRDNPYFAVSGKDGKFSIKGVPDGEYNFVAWHEDLGESAPQKVKVTGGTAEINFTFKAK